MLTALDHIIIGVHELGRASEEFRTRLGLQASGGGIHSFGGTENRIIVIGDTYVELIAVRTPGEAQKSMQERLDKGEGYLNFVLASDDIAADAQGLQQRGIAIIGPTYGQLNAGDGRSRGWWRVDIERSELTQHYPFLIQHDSVGAERRFRLAGWATPPEHHAGAQSVISVTLVVVDLEEAAQRFSTIYGLAHAGPYRSEVAFGEDAQSVAFTLSGTGQRFELAMPPANGNKLVEHLQRFGESVYRMTLGVKDLAYTRSYLDAQGVTYYYSEREQPTLWIEPGQACGAALTIQQVV